MYLFCDKKSEADLRYPIDYNILFKKGFQPISGLDIDACLMDYSDGSFVLLIKTKLFAYNHYNTLKEIAVKLGKLKQDADILKYEIFEYKVTRYSYREIWKVIFHKLPTNSW